jgi:hypothetical protein
MAGPTYTTHDVSLFSGLTTGGSLVPAGLGVGLIGLGLMLRLLQEQMKAASGQKPEFAAVYQEAVLCLVLLLLNGWVAHNVWSTCQYIATSIYPDSKLEALASLLMGVAGRFKDYSFSVLDVGTALKDSSVVLVALMAWLLTLLAHWQLEVLQVAVFNIVYAFAPILIGLSMFGIGGRRLWFSALVEVSSWSITMAIVYRTIDSAMHSYLQEASRLAFTDTKFIDVISLLGFMSSLPFIVPVVTGRLLGSQALGALAHVSAGGTMVDRALAPGRQAMQQMGGSLQPGAADVSPHTQAHPNAPVLRRPGD